MTDPFAACHVWVAGAHCAVGAAGQRSSSAVLLRRDRNLAGGESSPRCFAQPVGVGGGGGLTSSRHTDERDGLADPETDKRRWPSRTSVPGIAPARGRASPPPATTTCGALTRAWLSSSGAVCRGGRRLSAWRTRDYFKSQPPRSRPPEIASRPPTLNVYGLRRFSRMLGHRSSYPARHKLLGCVRHFVASRPGPGRLDGDTRAGWSGTLAVGSHACRACARRSRVRRPATR